MKYFIFLLILYISVIQSVSAQTEMILNGSFEDATLSHWTIAHPLTLCYPTTQPSYWWANPADPYNDMGYRLIDPANNYFGSQLPADGDNHMLLLAKGDNNSTPGDKGTVSYELPAALEKGKFYLLKFKVSKADLSTASPKLKILLNDNNVDPFLAPHQVIYEKKILDDGQPNNTSWAERKVLFRCSDTDMDWVIFKINNDNYFNTKWEGIYLDDIHLYEYCDWRFYNTPILQCSKTSGAINPVVTSLSDPPTEIPIHSYDDPFTIQGLQNATYVKIKIWWNGGIVRTIELSAKNGFPYGITWDGTNSGGAEEASAWYIAELWASNDEGWCTQIHTSFTFFKLNGETLPTVWTNPYNGGMLDAPKDYGFCCTPTSLIVTNEHFKATQWGHGTPSGGTIGVWTYKSSESITIGPNVVIDAGVRLNLIAPHINWVQPYTNNGIVHVNLTACPQKLASAQSIKNEEIRNEVIRNSELVGKAFTVSPNPTYGDLRLSFDMDIMSEEFIINLVDQFGHVIEYNSSKLSITADNYLINLKGYKPGVYFLNLFEAKTGTKIGSSEKIVLIE